MTNLLNVLKTMETETAGVKNDVINFLLAQSQDSEDAKGILENVLTHGCESGMVNHLIYYKDTVAYYEEHEEEIKDLVTEVYGIDFIEGSDFINQLSDLFPVNDFETRMNDHDIYEKAMEIVEDNNDITGDELIKDYNCYEEEIFNERYELATELNMQDKNYLAWAIFEYNASVLSDELDKMETFIVEWLDELDAYLFNYEV